MVRIPLKDTDDGRVRFGPEPSRRWWGRAAMLLAGVLLAWTALGGRALPLPLALALTALLFISGALIAGWSDTLEVDVRGQSVTQVRGFAPFRGRSEYPLSEYYRLALETKRKWDLFGEERVHRSLLLEGDERRIALFHNWDSPNAVQTAERLASLLGRPTPDEVLITSRPLRRLQHAVTYGMWGVMAGLAMLLVWANRPVIGAAGGQTRTRLSFPAQPLWQSHFDRGLFEYRSRRFEEAEKEFRKGLAASKDNAELLNMLAYAQAEQDRLSEALRTARLALEKAPDNWMIVDTVAEMHQRRREFVTAAGYYRRALRYAPSGQAGETHCKYGETLLDLGKKTEAIKQLQLAAVGVESLWADRARAALERLGVKPPARRLLPRRRPLGLQPPAFD